jgi:AhpC/TSA family
MRHGLQHVMPPSAGGRHDRLLALSGALLSTAALIGYFTLSVKVPSLRDSAWLNLLAVVAGLGLSIAALLRRRSAFAWAGLVLSTLMAAALIGFVFVLSSQLPSPAAAVEVGDRAPAFELADHRGEPVALSDFAGSKVVLVFFRGFW